MNKHLRSVRYIVAAPFYFAGMMLATLGGIICWMSDGISGEETTELHFRKTDRPE